MTYELPDIKIARIGHSELKDNNVSYMDLHYMVAERGREVIHFVDRNVLGLFEIEKTLAIMKAAGLKARF